MVIFKNFMYKMVILENFYDKICSKYTPKRTI